jgi:hypothetical protein
MEVRMFKCYGKLRGAMHPPEGSTALMPRQCCICDSVRMHPDGLDGAVAGDPGDVLRLRRADALELEPRLALDERDERLFLAVH